MRSLAVLLVVCPLASAQTNRLDAIVGVDMVYRSYDARRGAVVLDSGGKQILIPLARITLHGTDGQPVKISAFTAGAPVRAQYDRRTSLWLSVVLVKVRDLDALVEPRRQDIGDMRLTVNTVVLRGGTLFLELVLYNSSTTRKVDIEPWGKALGKMKTTDDVGNTYALTRSGSGFAGAGPLYPEKLNVVEVSFEAPVEKAAFLSFEFTTPEGKPVKVKVKAGAWK